MLHNLYVRPVHPYLSYMNVNQIISNYKPLTKKNGGCPCVVTSSHSGAWREDGGSNVKRIRLKVSKIFLSKYEDSYHFGSYHNYLFIYRSYIKLLKVVKFPEETSHTWIPLWTFWEDYTISNLFVGVLKNFINFAKCDPWMIGNDRTCIYLPFELICIGFFQVWEELLELLRKLSKTSMRVTREFEKIHISLINWWKSLRIDGKLIFNVHLNPSKWKFVGWRFDDVSRKP